MAITSAALNAVAAYGNTAKLGSGLGLGDAASAAGKSGGADFGAMVQNAIQSVVDKGTASDRAQAAYLQGKTGVVDVVTAVAETETAMQTMVSVRDKVISAYEDIMKMTI